MTGTLCCATPALEGACSKCGEPGEVCCADGSGGSCAAFRTVCMPRKADADKICCTLDPGPHQCSTSIDGSDAGTD